MLFTSLCLGHLSVRVGDSSQRSEEIVKNLNPAPLNAIIIIIIIIPLKSKNHIVYLKLLFTIVYKNQDYVKWFLTNLCITFTIA